MATKYISDIEIEGSLKVNGTVVGEESIPTFTAASVETPEGLFGRRLVFSESDFEAIGNSQKVNIRWTEDGGETYRETGTMLVGKDEVEPYHLHLFLEKYVNAEGVPYIFRLDQNEDNSLDFVVYGLQNYLVTSDYLRYLCHIRVAHTTAQGTYDYGFNISVKQDEDDFTQLTDVAQYLYSKNVRDEIPASGTYTEGNNVYLVTGVKPLSNNMMQVNMVKLSDGTTRTIETGMVSVTYDVEW